ncbi:hypothetical protein XACS582_14260006 [Xanthomonas citri pv. citri]|nr:hypothetical protein XACJK2_2180024 [Xanthomonas citri pv. citri]CEH59253.1 hypothetical protein XACJK48_9060002 [Xanthomonas citri pv. citri]CEH60303.1 hypothetical protein XACS582_14260006 [Xanthomonas citri pv. citri]CEI02951.1 hypothetical protein XACS581_3440019 [Xanthomonas citri pv. citri]
MIRPVLALGFTFRDARLGAGVPVIDNLFPALFTHHERAFLDVLPTLLNLDFTRGADGFHLGPFQLGRFACLPMDLVRHEMAVNLVSIPVYRD